MKKNKLYDFIKKAKEVHKDENLDYSKAVYINNRTPLCIIDHDLKEDGSEYGEYWQTPYNHLKGQSHPLKRGKKIANKKSSSQEDFINRAKEIHKGENIDYSQVEYVNMHTKVKLIDHDLKEDGNEYGEYWQEPCVHLKGCGHPLKGLLKNKASTQDTKESFIEKCLKIHRNKPYTYDKVNYINSRKKVCITCRKINSDGNEHGDFWIMPTNFLSGKGCPKCGYHYSKVEDELYDYISQYIFVEKHNRTILNGKEIDLFIPSLNIGIEYNGLRWHSEWFGGKDKNFHLNKLNGCNEKGVYLLQIFEDEYVNHKDIVINKINHILGLKKELPKIMARKCEIREVNKKTAKEFLEQYHIQGYVMSTLCLGAFYEEKLIGVMTFKQETTDSNNWELNRFASDYNYICQGIGGKLFKHFVKIYNPNEIKSFADRRWTINKDSNVYTKLGFELKGVLNPEYRYYKTKDGCIRQHKFGFRKQILNRKYGLPLTMSETEMVKELGYDRIWDCGLFKYVWKKC